MAVLRRSSAIAAPRWPAVRRAVTLACMVALMATCAVNFVMAPTCMCLMDGGCKPDDASFASYGAYPRAIAVTCFASFAAMLYARRSAAAAYRRIVRACELYAPAAAQDHRDCAAFDAAFTVLCLSVTLPVNVLRLYLLHAQDAHPGVIGFFVLLYLQNVGMCLLETRFVALCYALHKRFAHVNRDLERLGEETFGVVVAASEATAAGPLGRVTYAADFYGSAAVAGRRSPTANVAEIIRVRHRLVRDAVHALVDMFGVPMGMSLSALFVMTLFDIYYEVFAVAGVDTRWIVFIYMWVLQYSMRFYGIVATAHNMTKQALKSKVLITDMNSRYLDNETKEELYLFFSQISSCTIEFTACDFFTLNMHLITSVIAAGTTFLVILLQLDS